MVEAAEHRRDIEEGQRMARRLWLACICVLCVPGAALLAHNLVRGLLAVFRIAPGSENSLRLAIYVTQHSYLATIFGILMTWMPPQFASTAARRCAVAACAVAVLGTVYYWSLRG